MNTISLVFKVHHPFYLRPYRFFDIGRRHNYYDDYRNKYLLKRFSERSYYQANALMGRLLDRYGEKFCFSFVFTGSSMDQMQWYMPELLDDFRRLVARPGVELLATDYSGSAISIMDRELWKQQVELHRQRTFGVFGKKPDVLAGTQLLYDDSIGTAAARMGFAGMLTEGAKPVLGWKSPHVVYSHPDEKLKLILRDGGLSEDISLRFSDRNGPQWPFTADKFIDRMQADRISLDDNSHVTIYVNYGVLGEFQERESGIFEFFEALPEQVLSKTGFKFVTPSRLCSLEETYPVLHVPYTVSDMDEEKDLTAFYANELQTDVMENWKRACSAMKYCTDGEMHKDFRFLTGVEILGFMSTKYFAGRPSIRYLNPYDSPYDAYINYMNVWSDFLSRMKAAGLLDESGRTPYDPSAVVADKVRQAMGLAADKVKTAASVAGGAVSELVSKARKSRVSKKVEAEAVEVGEQIYQVVNEARQGLADVIRTARKQVVKAASKTARTVKEKAAGLEEEARAIAEDESSGKRKTAAARTAKAKKSESKEAGKAKKSGRKKAGTVGAAGRPLAVSGKEVKPEEKVDGKKR